MLVLPADHLIEPVEEFLRATQQAAALAARGKLVTFGIRPESPETGYGYIEAGENFDGGEAREVLRFVEKPDAQDRAGLPRQRQFPLEQRHVLHARADLAGRTG